MRLVIVILIATIMQVSASGFAQKISLSQKKEPLNSVLKEIRKQSGYNFIITGELLKQSRPVSIEVNQIELSDALTLIFKEQPLTYTISNKTVVIKEKEKSFFENLAARFQVIDIKGQIVDEKGNPLTGATVMIKGSSRSIKTNDEGAFYLQNVDEQAVLMISYIGYQTREIDAKANLGTLTLKINDGKLDEIQIIGYGQTTRKLNTGSMSSISAKQIEQQPITNVLSALSGRMPGVFVQTTNGLPGGNISVQIRGKGSILAGTDPLYIIDGMPYDGSAPAKGSLAVNNIAGSISPLNNINPADIESITVLKDADATSIYGSRGTNGVVLITTKRSKTGATKLDANIQQGFSTLVQRPQLLNLDDYLSLRKEAFSNDGKTPSANPSSANYAPDLTVWNQSQSTDWVDYLFGGTAHSTDAQVKLSGGQANTTFSISGNYRQETTVLPGQNDFQRGGLTSHLQHHSENNKLNISLISQLTQANNDLSNLFKSLGSFGFAPNYPLYLEDGSLNWYSGANPVADANARSKTGTDNLITNLNVGYNLVSSLNIKLNAGYTKTRYQQTLIFPTSSLTPGTVNYSQFGDNGSRSFLIEPQLDYSMKFKNSALTFLAGATFQNRKAESKYIQASNFKLEDVMEDLSSAGTIDSRTSNFSEYKYASVFGRITYNLKDSYVINATIRRDGSSRFGTGNRFGNFGSIGATWIFSNLSFIKDKVPFLNLGKFRASYGTTGNDQIGDYQYLSTYSSPGTNIYQDMVTIRPNRISNADFHWETTRKLDLAMDLGFLKDRISISVDYYRNQSKDQLVLYSIPQITGFASYQANLPAVLINKGWEFSINARIIDQKAFSWSTMFNLTIPKNTLKSFQNFENSSYATSYELGHDISRIAGYSFVGMDPNTGKPQYAGENGTYSATPYYNFTLGKTSPDCYGGYNNTFNFKNFELNVFAQFVKQQSFGSINNNPGAFAANNFELVKNRWSAENPQSTIPKATTSYDFYYLQSSLNLFNTSYLRLKNVSLTYAVDAKLLKKLKFDHLKIYAQGQNLYTLWKKNTPLFDPESGGFFANSSRNFPPLKTFVFGLQFTL